ncbi:hypothetical protein [Synechococcus sp. FACHB-909]|uniref:hypothetical protein n=1 Tax=Synechococcus sp. FACHB-909 TaxID=2692863 RepID=UPI001688D56D|nr:hypothetical protein [Synechococcus sp. FACHB-909]MBD2718111.1 hypothetical protein [Synechococcus sp. FACHB-909]
MFSETTTTEYAADLAADLAAHGVEALQDLEVSVSELQTLPLAPAAAAEAARMRAALLTLQAGFAALPGLLEAADG